MKGQAWGPLKKPLLQGQLAGLFPHRAWRQGRLHSGAYYLLAYSLATAGTGFFFWVVAARLYPAPQVGLASSAISAAMLLGVLATLGLHHGLVRFLPGSPRGSHLANAAFSVASLGAGLAASIFLMGLDWWAPALAPLLKNPLGAPAFAASVMAVALTPLLLHAFLAQGQALLVLLVGGLDGTMKLFLLALGGWLGLSAQVIFASWSIAVTVGFLVGLCLVPRALPGYRPRPARGIGPLLPLSLASYVSELAWYSPTSGLMGWVLPLIVMSSLGPGEAAYFYIAWASMGLANAIPVATATSLFAHGSHAPAQVQKNARRTLRLALGLLTPLVVLVWFLGDVLLLVFGQAYSEKSAGLLRWLALAALPLAFNTQALAIWRVEKRLGRMVVLGSLVASLTVSLSLFFLPRWGIGGVGAAWLLAQGAGALVLGRTAWRPRGV